MTDLPPGWEWVTLDDLQANESRAITDGPFGSNLKTSHYTSTGARVIRLQNIGDGVFVDEAAYISVDYFESLKQHEAREGDLIVASLGEELPRACLVPRLREPAIVKADCIRVRLNPAVDPRWVLYALISPQTKTYTSTRIRGVGRPRVGLKAIRRIPLPLPPLAEQRRIVAALDDHLSRLDAVIISLDHILNRLDRFREHVTTAACTGHLKGTSEHSDAASFKDAGVADGSLPPVPDSWRWARLKDIADVVGGVTKDASKQDNPTLPEVPYLRVANVQRGSLDLSNVARIRVPANKLEQLRLQLGDVLLNEGGDRDKLGRGWIWEGQIVDCIHQNHVFRARVHDRTINPKLLAWHANSFGRRWFERNGKQSVNLASISLSTIKLFPVPIPPLSEQDAIVAATEERLAVLDQGEGLVRWSLARAEALRRSLLTEAFAGRMVAQNPNDEPAADVLARIRAEREDRPTQRRTRRSNRASTGISRNSTSGSTQEEVPL